MIEHRCERKVCRMNKDQQFNQVTRGQSIIRSLKRFFASAPVWFAMSPGGRTGTEITPSRTFHAKDDVAVLIMRDAHSLPMDLESFEPFSTTPKQQ